MRANLPLLFFLLLIPLSGFIAWAGDRIGHRIGKRRHSLFGLRPRHTAILITVASGMCIALVSFGLMWGMSASFRVVLAQGAELFRTNRTLKQENRGLVLSNRILENRAEKQKRAAQESNRAASEASAQALKARMDAAVALAARKKAEQRYRAARTRAEQAAADVARAQRNVADAGQKLAGLRASLSRTNRSLGAKAKALESAERDLRTAKADLASARSNVKDARAKETLALQAVERAKKSLDSVMAYQKEQLLAKNKELAAQSERITKQNNTVADQAAKIEMQRLELNRLALDLKDKRREMDQLISQALSHAASLRRNQITYEMGDEVDRLSINAGLNIWRLQVVLESLLAAAAKKAEARGAAPASTGRAVFVLPRSVAAAAAVSSSEPDRPPGSGSGNGPVVNTVPPQDTPPRRMPDDDDAIHAVADLIRRANQDVVVQVVSAANAVAGEPVPVELRISRNPRVFAEGDKIGEVTLDGTEPRQVVADALYSFLRHNLRERLLKAGIIPPAQGGGAATGSGDGSVFSLSGEEWLKVLDEVCRSGPKVHVTVRAARDMRAADPVALRFDVRGPRVTYNRPD